MLLHNFKSLHGLGSLTPSIHSTMPNVCINGKVEARIHKFTELWDYSVPTETRRRGFSSFHRSRRFPRRLSCHHDDQVDEKASSRRSRPRPPCTSKAKHQGNDENQVLEDRGEVAEEAAALVLDHAVGVARVLSWLAQGA